MSVDNFRKIRALIVDDEPLARQTIRLLLKDDSEIEIIGECGDGARAVNFVGKHSPDLIFLDVQMPEMNGFEVVKKINTEKMPAVVFVTAFDRYAIRAFEVNALDYLLKPFGDERFAEALRRAKAEIKNQELHNLSRRLVALLENQTDEKPPNEKPAEKEYFSRLTIKSNGRTFFIDTGEISWIAADDYYAQVHAHGKSYLLRETLNELEANLNPQKFVRIHRSTIINLDYLKEMRPFFHGDYIVVLRDGTELRLSRSRRASLESALKTNRG